MSGNVRVQSHPSRGLNHSGGGEATVSAVGKG